MPSTWIGPSFDSTPAVFRLNPGTGIVSGNRACGSESHGFWIGFDVLDVGAGDPKFASSCARRTDNNGPIHPQVRIFRVSVGSPCRWRYTRCENCDNIGKLHAWGNAEGGVMFGSDVGHLQIIHSKFLATDARTSTTCPHRMLTAGGQLQTRLRRWSMVVSSSATVSMP